MAVMRKRVNIKTTVALRNFTPPLYGTYNGVHLTTGEILSCLCKRAIVDEVLDDGTLVRLNMSNYYTDNSYLMKKQPLDKPMGSLKDFKKKQAEEKKAAKKVEVETHAVNEIATPITELTQKVEFLAHTEAVNESIAETVVNNDSAEVTSGYIAVAENDGVEAKVESITTTASSADNDESVVITATNDDESANEVTITTNAETATPKKRNYNKKK